MLQKGSMRNVKVVLGWIIVALGAGLILFPIEVIALLTQWKIIVGFLLITLGYLNARAGSQL